MIPQIIVDKKGEAFSSYLIDFIKKNEVGQGQIFTIHPAKKEILINQIREVKKVINIQTKTKKLFVFYSFNKATTEAQNAFLKILEEQNKSNYFMMQTNSLHQILPTIISRSKIIYLDKNLTTDLINIKLDSFLLKNDFSFFLDKSFIIKSKEEGEKIILSLIIKLKELQKKQTDYNLSDLIKKGFELLKLLEENNLSPQLTVDNYLILIKKEINIIKRDDSKSQK